MTLEDKVKTQFGFDDQETELFLACAGLVRIYAPGEFIISESSHGREIYYLIEGRLEVLKNIGGGKDKLWGYVSEGDFFGEAGLLEYPQNLRSASIRAIVQSAFVSFTKKNFDSLFVQDGELALKLFYKITKGLMAKLRERGDDSALLYLSKKRS